MNKTVVAAAAAAIVVSAGAALVLNAPDGRCVRVPNPPGDCAKIRVTKDGLKRILGTRPGLVFDAPSTGRCEPVTNCDDVKSGERVEP